MLLFFVILLLTGCTSENTQLDQALLLRDNINRSNACAFVANITADYGDYTSEFSLKCSADKSGNISFSLLRPETIMGVTGSVTSAGGNLTFDDKILAFPALTEGELSPVCAPMIFIRGLRSGYIRTAGGSGDITTVVIDDSYQGESLQLEIQIDQNNLPINCQIMWQGVRVLMLEIENFEIL